MTKVRLRGEAIRRFILDNVEQHPNAISKVTAEHFKITRQAVNKHLHTLEKEKALKASGSTRNKSYNLCPVVQFVKAYKVQEGLTEDAVWRNDIAPVLNAMPENVLDIWHYGFTEMFNNAIDHPEANAIVVNINKIATRTEVLIYDNGIGIFKKIQTALNLSDERHAVLELHKGKLTTDPENHSGEGIFFSSRMFDEFNILSGGVFFSHEYGKNEDWILEREIKKGTTVWMSLNNHTARTTKKVFDQFTTTEDYGFDKTVVPVRLAQYGNDKLISRSQAKRVVSRVELFKVVIFDFKGVSTVGQAFADEIFRVFAKKHPEIELHAINANSEIKRMISRAKIAESGRLSDVTPES